MASSDDNTDTPSLSRKGAATRARILDAARNMLVDCGYDGLVMRSVAAAAGMTLGNLQHYFATREALLAAVVRAEADSRRHPPAAGGRRGPGTGAARDRADADPEVAG